MTHLSHAATSLMDCGEGMLLQALEKLKLLRN